MASSRDRFSQRRQRQGRRRWVTRLIGVAVFAVIAAGIYLVGFSGVLAVDEVSVRGTDQLTHDDVEAVAKVPLGTPLVRLDTVAISTRVSRLPLVESVDVSRSWPHGVTIQVVERKPVAWTSLDGRTTLVDRFGVAYLPVERPPGDLVQIITDGAASDQRQRALEEAAAVLATLRRSDPGLVGATDAVRATSRDTVTLDLRRARTVVWGSRERTSDKLAVLRALLKTPAAQYDVSAPEQPTTRQ